MKQLVPITLIIGFLVVDFLFFHDVFKSGEIITPTQYLTGFLSIMVFAFSAQTLRKTVR